LTYVCKQLSETWAARAMPASEMRSSSKRGEGLGARASCPHASVPLALSGLSYHPLRLSWCFEAKSVWDDGNPPPCSPHPWYNGSQKQQPTPHARGMGPVSPVALLL
jgi:hypothetical protein